MPSINLPLQQLGPLIDVLLGPSLPRQEALRAAGLAVPSFVRGTFLIDTGASMTCVDPELIEPLNLVATATIAVQTPSTNGVPHECAQYDAMLFMPGTPDGGYIIEAVPVVTTVLRPQGIDGLLGRDVLDRCTLIYNGSARMVTLAY